MTQLTELDAAIIAEENGWEYLPACDEVELLLAELESFPPTEVSAPEAAPARKVNKRNLRKLAIKEVMDVVKNGEWNYGDDWQTVGQDLINDDRFAPLFEGKDEDETRDYVMGIVRFCEWACGYWR